MDVARTEGTDQNLIANKLTQTIFSANSGPTNVSSAFGAFPKLPFCRSRAGTQISSHRDKELSLVGKRRFSRKMNTADRLRHR
jgi:hypothetical protein